MPFARFHLPGNTDAAESIHAARRNLLLLVVLGALGTLLAGVIGLASNSLTLQSLQQVDVAARALRFHIQADMMHDMMRGDVFSHAAGIEASEEEFEEHSREMEENLAQLERLPLPDSVPPRIAAERKGGCPPSRPQRAS